MDSAESVPELFYINRKYSEEIDMNEWIVLLYLCDQYGYKRKNPFLMNGYIFHLVTCFDNRGFTKHYDAKVRIIFEQAK